MLATSVGLSCEVQPAVTDSSKGSIIAKEHKALTVISERKIDFLIDKMQLSFLC